MVSCRSSCRLGWMTTQSHCQQNFSRTVRREDFWTWFAAWAHGGGGGEQWLSLLRPLHRQRIAQTLTLGVPGDIEKVVGETKTPFQNKYYSSKQINRFGHRIGAKEGQSALLPQILSNIYKIHSLIGKMKYCIHYLLKFVTDRA